jgi:hypothetical protein
MNQLPCKLQSKTYYSLLFFYKTEKEGGEEWSGVGGIWEEISN